MQEAEQEAEQEDVLMNAADNAPDNAIIIESNASFSNGSPEPSPRAPSNI